MAGSVVLGEKDNTITKAVAGSFAVARMQEPATLANTMT